MQKASKLRILWYVKPTIRPYLGFLVLIGGFIAMMGMLHQRGLADENALSIVHWVGGGLILLTLIPYFADYLRIFRVFLRADIDSCPDALCEDFAAARVVGQGFARLGKTWFFGKGGRNIVAYEDMKRVFLHEHYAGLQRNQRELRYVDAQGKEHPLCGLPLFGKRGESIAQEIMSALPEKRDYPAYPTDIRELSHGGR